MSIQALAVITMLVAILAQQASAETHYMDMSVSVTSIFSYLIVHSRKTRVFRKQRSETQNWNYLLSWSGLERAVPQIFLTLSNVCEIVPLCSKNLLERCRVGCWPLVFIPLDVCCRFKTQHSREIVLLWPSPQWTACPRDQLLRSLKVTHSSSRWQTTRSILQLCTGASLDQFLKFSIHWPWR